MDTNIKDYNTQRNPLRISEYGRNVQKMIEYALSIEDRNIRTQYAYIIFDVMQQINPDSAPNDDYYKKLWNHMYIISDYKLDIDFPFEVASKEVVEKAPEQVPYSSNRIQYRFYGKNIENMLQNLANEEDVENIDGIIESIADQMKHKYISWNKEIVSDELISKHINVITNGKLNFDYLNHELTSANQILNDVLKSDVEANKSAAKKGRGRIQPKRKKQFKPKRRR
jgi:hypothetical protein